ncbi:MAG: hypothetical protein ACJAU6_001007 [Alphaproteobacteria bacterium]
MSLSFLDIVGHTSFLLTALSFYVRDMMVLRALAVVSGVVGVAYNYWLPAGPLWLVIFWLGVFVAINVVRIVGIVLDRRSIDFNEEEAELHETVFQNFSPVEFRKLMRIGEWRNAAQGDQLTAQGAIVGGLNLLFNGEVLVERDGAEIGRARDGAMIGEISFIQGGPATATVSATKPCRYVSWSGDELRKLLTRNPSMDIAMKHVFSIDLMRKLTV